MDTRQGNVTKLRTSVEVTGGGSDNNSHVSTTHVATFQLGNQAVRMKSSAMPILNEGDEVTVAGVIKNGLFWAFAYHNRTTGVSESSAGAMQLALGIIFALAGIALVIAGFLIRGSGMLVWLLIGCVFVGAGIHALSSVSRAQKALALVRDSQ